MPLNLIHGPPNSGRAGIVRRRFTEELARSPLLVLPTVDDVFSFERELCREEGALLGGGVHTFDGLFEQVAGAAGAVCPAADPARSARAVAECRRRARRSRGSSPALLRARASPRLPPTWSPSCRRRCSSPPRSRLPPPGSRTPPTWASWRRSTAPTRTCATPRVSATGTSSPREAIAALREDPDAWEGRPVFLYGFDDLTREQLELVAALSRRRPRHGRTHLRGPPGAGCAGHPARRAPRDRAGGWRRRRSPTRRTPRARCSTRSSAASATARRFPPSPTAAW